MNRSSPSSRCSRSAWCSRCAISPAEDIWQTRFLAPTDMQDGTYTVRLILRDRLGQTYRESKTFVIASKPPVVEVKLDRKRFQRGQAIALKVQRLREHAHAGRAAGRGGAVELRWNPQAAANTGELIVPEQTIPGAYKLTVTAEDIAHNIGTGRCKLKYFLDLLRSRTRAFAL